MKYNFKQEEDTMAVFTNLLQVDPWLIQSDKELIDKDGHVNPERLKIFVDMIAIHSSHFNNEEPKETPTTKPKIESASITKAQLIHFFENLFSKRLW